VVKKPPANKFIIPVTGPSVLADITVTSKEGSRYNAAPMIVVDSFGLNQIDDTVYAQNIFLKFG